VISDTPHSHRTAPDPGDVAHAAMRQGSQGSSSGCEVILAAQEFAELSAAILGRGSSIRFRARGRSMLPLIRNRDVLTARPVSVGTLRVGDIVLHRIGRDRLVAHRIVRLGHTNGKAMLTTRGDASLAPGDQVSAEQVLGHVVALRRGGRSVWLDRGAWRLAGVLWVRLWPIGPTLLHLMRGALSLCRRHPHGGRWLAREQGDEG